MIYTHESIKTIMRNWNFTEHDLHNGEIGYRRNFTAIVAKNENLYIGHDYSANTNVITKANSIDELAEWVKYFDRI